MAYKKINWTSETPINTTNLNKMDVAIFENANPKRACFGFSDYKEVESGDEIPFDAEIYNNSNEKIKLNADSTITINHTGYIMVSYHIWIHTKSSKGRPWVYFRSLTDSQKSIDTIASSPDYYVTLSVANRIMPVVNGEIFGMNITEPEGLIELDSGSGKKTSFITIELI